MIKGLSEALQVRGSVFDLKPKKQCWFGWVERERHRRGAAAGRTRREARGAARRPTAARHDRHAVFPRGPHVRLACLSIVLLLNVSVRTRNRSIFKWNKLILTEIDCDCIPCRTPSVRYLVPVLYPYILCNEWMTSVLYQLKLKLYYFLFRP